jgi:hypothetical protein
VFNNINNGIFRFIPDKIVICNKNDIITIENILKNDKKCYTIDCSDNWRSKQKKIISDDTNTCLDSCNNNITYKYEYLGKCYKNCQKDSLVVDNYNICSCELEQCLYCNSVSLSKNLCTKCNVNYYPKENDPLNLGEYINCFINPIGYYLDLNEGL